MKRIKSIKNIILLGYLIIGFTSCDFLDRSDPDKLNKNDFYKTENDMYQALNAAYDGLKTNYYNNMYYWTEIRSDNTTLASKTANSGIYNVSMYTTLHPVMQRYNGPGTECLPVSTEAM